MTEGAGPSAVDGTEEVVLLGVPLPSMDGIEDPPVLVEALGVLLLADRPGPCNIPLGA